MKLYWISILILFSSCAGFLKQEVSTTSNVVSDVSISRDEYYESLGKAYSEDGQWEIAIENFKLSRLNNPKRLSAYFLASDEYLKQDQLKMAADELNLALDQDKNNLQVLLKLGELYFTQKIYPKAKVAFETVLQLDQKNEKANWSMYFINKIEANYSEALKFINRLEKIKKNDPVVIFEKAICYKNLKDFKSYIAKIEQSYFLNTKDKVVLIEYAESLYSIGEFKKAVQELSNYLLTSKFNIEISNHLIFSAIKSESFDLAVKEIERSHQNGFSDVKSQLKLAHVYFLKNESANAEKIYLQILSQNESDEALFYLAKIYQQQGNNFEASRYYRDVSDKSNYFGLAQLEWANYKKSSGLWDEAQKILKLALQKQTSDIDLHKGYADFLIDRNDLKEANKYLEKALIKFPRDVDIKLKMAYVQYQLNHENSYKEQILNALRLDSKNSNVYLLLNEVWDLKKKKPQELVYFFKKANDLKNTNVNIKPLLDWALMQHSFSAEAVSLFEELHEKYPNNIYYIKSLSKIYENANIKLRSKELQQLAVQMENNRYLRTKIDNIDAKVNTNVDIILEKPSRLPASLSP